MSKFFKSTLASSIGLAILGVLLFFQSEVTIVSISYVIGAILIAIGVLAAMKFVNNVKKEVKDEMNLVYGVVTVILGIIVICNPKAIGSIIPLIIGIIIVLSSATKLQYGIELKKNDNNLWKSTMIISIITMIVGIVLIFNPFKGAEFIAKIMGVLIFAYAVLDIITTISIHKTIKTLHKAIADSVTEAEVVEEKSEKEEE